MLFMWRMLRQHAPPDTHTKKITKHTISQTAYIEEDNCTLIWFLKNVSDSWIKSVFKDAPVVLNAILVIHRYCGTVTATEKAQPFAEGYRDVTHTAFWLQSKRLRESLNTLSSFSWGTDVKVSIYWDSISLTAITVRILTIASLFLQ